jgi:hypothetical protein
MPPLTRARARRSFGGKDKGKGSKGKTAITELAHELSALALPDGSPAQSLAVSLPEEARAPSSAPLPGASPTPARLPSPAFPAVSDQCHGT